MASAAPPTDPRLAARGAAETREESVRPVVAVRRGGPSGLVIGIGIAVAAILLFMALNARRQSLSQPPVTARGAELGASAPPPPLYLPPQVVEVPPPPVAITPAPARPLPVVVAPTPRPSPPPPPPPVYIQQPQVRPLNPPMPVRASNGPTLVIDTTTTPQASPNSVQVVGDGQAGGGALGSTQGVGRVRAGVFANRSSSVAQGTLIPAILETAFDSTRPGFARAIVSRDVRGFDGTRILIPRGSRLTGEYRSDIQPGQRRALINWTRLLRPDGVTIGLGSPATDTLGRGGVSGHYNSHFWERFGSAILQSALDVGVNLATRAASGNVILALPGSTQALSPVLLQSARIVPTVTVPAGTSISVFVARDLDFSGAETAR
jgi:type IV secretion system protein VirB10